MANLVRMVVNNYNEILESTKGNVTVKTFHMRKKN